MHEKHVWDGVSVRKCVVIHEVIINITNVDDAGGKFVHRDTAAHVIKPFLAHLFEVVIVL